MTFREELPGYNPAKLEAWIFEEHIDDGGWEKRVYENTNNIGYRNIKERMPPQNYPRMLVVGCGNGSEVKVMNNLGYNTTGITLNCKAERDIAKANGCDVRYMDMHDMAFAPETFDCIYNSMSLEHSVSVWLALAEMWVVLKEGGLLWLTLPTPKNSDLTGPKDQHLMLMDDWFMVPCLKTAGFEILHTINNLTNYEFLCKRLPIEKVEPYKQQIYRRLLLLAKENHTACQS